MSQQNPFRYPPIRGLHDMSAWDQIHKIEEELLEVKQAIIDNDVLHVREEILDLEQAVETLVRKFHSGAELHENRVSLVINKNRRRNYYDQ